MKHPDINTDNTKNLRVFGDETYEHITDEILIDLIVEHNIDTISKVIKILSKHPENKNLHSKEKNGKRSVSVYRECGWVEEEDAEKCFDELINNVYEFIYGFVVKNKQKIDDKYIELNKKNPILEEMRHQKVDTKNLRVFGDENVDFIEDKDIEDILNQDCTLHDKAQNLVQLIHFNKNVLENRNVYIESLYGTFIPFVYRENGWKAQYDEQFIPNLINHKKKMLLLFYNMCCEENK